MKNAWCALVLAGLMPVLANGGVHDHSDHAQAESGEVKLRLNQGQKWKTDAPLRQGMEKIKKLLGSRLDAIHEGKAKEPIYAQLGTQVDEQIQFLFKNCKLTPEADAQLHIVIAQMMKGSELMKSGKSLDARRSGAVEVVKALGKYPRFFEHPGWKPLVH